MKSLKKLTMVLFLGLVLLIPGSTVAADDTKKGPAPVTQVETKASPAPVTVKQVPKNDAKELLNDSTLNTAPNTTPGKPLS